MPIGNNGPFGLPGGGGPNLATEFALPNRLFADPPQPEPSDSQWMFAFRNWDQPQPWYSRRGFPVVAAAVVIGTFVSAAPQVDAAQIQPQIWKQQLDLVSLGTNATLSPNQFVEDVQPRFFRAFFPPAAQGAQQPPATWTARPQDDPSQTQPWFSKALPGNLSPRMEPAWFASPQTDPTQLAPFFVGQTVGQRVPTPVKPLWTAVPQDDPTQLQPWFSKQQLTSGATAQPFGQIWTARPQDDPTQIQPQVWRQYLLSAKPIPVQFTAAPQADPSQLQPWFSTQQPPSQATQTPPNHPWFAFPQDDPTQIQPYIGVPTAALIPSVPTPPPVLDGGAAGLGNYPPISRYRRLREQELREEERLRQLAAEEKRIQAVIEKARDRKIEAKNERRLAKNRQEQEQQKQLVIELTKEIAQEIKRNEESDLIQYMKTEEEDLISVIASLSDLYLKLKRLR